MDLLNIVLVLAIIYIIFLMIKKNNSSISGDTFVTNVPTTEEEHVEKTIDKYISSREEYEKNLDNLIKATHKKRTKNIKPNGSFLDVQFHNDYRDLLTAINNVAPDQKQIFNMGNIPVKTHVPKENNHEVKRLVHEFMREINSNIKNEVTDTLNPNSGWDELMPNKNEKSGWEKTQEALGLPSSVYNQPAGKSKMRLVKIDSVIKQETDTEIKYICKLIIKKKNVNDQVILRVSFVIHKQNVDERKLFEDVHCNLNKIDNIRFDQPGVEANATSYANVIIEEIFIVGFLTSSHVDAIDAVNQVENNEYDFSRMENNEMTSNSSIMKQLQYAYMKRANEANKFDQAMDKETRDFHWSLQN